MLRVLVVNTNSNEIFRQLAEEHFHNVVPEDVEVELSFPTAWPTLIVDAVSLARTVPVLLEQAERARTGAYDAVLVNQHSDPGIEALRQMLDVPVVGLGETAMVLAAQLASTFSMVTCRHTRTTSMMAIDMRLARTVGVQSKVASYRAFGDASTLAALLSEHRARCVDLFVEHSVEAVREDGAGAVYLAGSVFGYLLPELVPRITDALEAAGFSGVPVIEPMRTALNAARVLADLDATRGGAMKMPEHPAESVPEDGA